VNSVAIAILTYVTLQRVGELLLAHKNTTHLLAQGAHEVGAAHYPFMVGLHATFLLGLWILAWNRAVDPVWLVALLILQAGRLWVLASMGQRWTTRIIVLPGAPLVAKGPYRFFRHPNYAVVCGEIIVIPMVFALPLYALVFSVLNAAMLYVRIHAEDAALADLRGPLQRTTQAPSLPPQAGTGRTS
jgi:methyltransferase